MFVIKIADLNIAIENRYELVFDVCKKYIVDSDEFLFKISVSDEEMDTERIASGDGFSDGYIESICIYRHIALELPKYDAFVMHCAAIEFEGRAYCFAAKSGTGKTTHITLWRKVLGNKVHIINGDKPIMRFYENKLYVCGTPWGGKEGLNDRVVVPMQAVCFIHRAEINLIQEISKHDALGKLLQQVFIPQNVDLASKTIDLIGRMLEVTPMWSLGCNISDDAAITALNAMRNQE